MIGIRLLSVLFAGLALAGCSSGGERSALGAVVGSVVPALGGGGPGAVDPNEIPAGFDPRDIAAHPENYALINVPAMFPTGAARVTGVRGNMITYESQYGFSATYRDGMLVATRGLGFDLIAADAGQTRAALRAGGGSVTRVHETLDENDQIVRFVYECEVTGGAMEEVDLGVRKATGRAFVESCLGGGVQFDNLYWIGPAGEILTSRQFSTLTVAYLRANPL